MVLRVNPTGPASEAGFEQGDIFLTVGAEGVDEVVDVVEAVGASTIGGTRGFGVIRGTDNVALSVAVGERPAPQHQDRQRFQGESAPTGGTNL